MNTDNILFLTDLDGTLLNYTAKLKPRAAEMLNRAIEKGALFSYATARGFKSSRQITAGLKLNLPLILMNGAIIADPTTGKPIVNNFIKPASCKAAADFFKENGESPMVYSYIDGRVRVSFVGTQNYYKKDDEKLRPCENFDELCDGDVFYFAFIEPKIEIDKLKQFFSSPSNGFNYTYYKNVYTGETWFECFRQDVSKAAAALKLKEITGASKIIAFGDNLNDIPMFEVADECYAVANAVAELKAIATGIIPSNEEMGVPVFIEKRTARIWDYAPPIAEGLPDKGKFASAISAVGQADSGGVGTLNEKPIHAALKNYFSEPTDQEAKIGAFFADVAGQNGIYEIQTSSWSRLHKKLDVFLDASHVTVVYPFEQCVHITNIDETTGELLTKTKRNYKDLSKFFLELYRIKRFLTHPNLTVCLCGLEIEKTRYLNPKKPRKKPVSVKKPLALLSEVHLNRSDDYKIFLPADLPEVFGKKRLPNSLTCEILEYMSVIRKCGRKGNEFQYSIND